MRRILSNCGQTLMLLGLFWTACIALGADRPAVRVEPSDSVGPRAVEAQTRSSVVRDYVSAWKGMSRALEKNNASLLDVDFLGTAKDKLADTVQDQRKLGLTTRYEDRKHNIAFAFYSPEGMSIQLVDSVEYDVQLLDHGQVIVKRHVRTRYLAVLTPTEVRWKVRIFQALPPQ